MVTGIVYDKKYLEHEQTPTHPERRERLAYTLDQLIEEGIFDFEEIKLIKPERANIDDVLSVHTKDYVSFLEKMSKTGGVIDWDTNIPIGLFEVALLAAGGAIKAAKSVVTKEVKNAFAMIRPPGHHAKPYTGAGFCYLNNMAIMTRWLQKRDFKKILILDWDAHHGDGTQEIFYDEDGVLFVSLHQMPLYPGTGYPHEIGWGKGEGYTVNVPLPPGSSDECYLYIFKEIIEPLATEYQPDFIAISAGQDNHFTDPITDLALTAQGYAKMMKNAVRLSDELCEGRLVAVLEGGYSIERALPYTNLGIIAAMVGLDISFIKEPKNYLGFLKLRKDPHALSKVRKTVENVKGILSRYWNIF